MSKQGAKLEIGDIIKVWWRSKQASVIGFSKSIHPCSRIAKLSDGRSMLVFDSDMMEIVDGN